MIEIQTDFGLEIILSVVFMRSFLFYSNGVGKYEYVEMAHVKDWYIYLHVVKKNLVTMRRPRTAIIYSRVETWVRTLYPFAQQAKWMDIAPIPEQY